MENFQTIVSVFADIHKRSWHARNAVDDEIEEVEEDPSTTAL
jgi:hypothetical protein